MKTKTKQSSSVQKPATVLSLWRLIICIRKADHLDNHVITKTTYLNLLLFLCCLYLFTDFHFFSSTFCNFLWGYSTNGFSVKIFQIKLHYSISVFKFQLNLLVYFSNIALFFSYKLPSRTTDVRCLRKHIGKMLEFKNSSSQTFLREVAGIVYFKYTYNICIWVTFYVIGKASDLVLVVKCL